MKLKRSLFLIATLISLSSRAQTSGGEEKLIVLPLFGYSYEQGLGVGANAAWVNIEGSSWSVDTSLFASALYSQTFLSANVINRKFQDLLYIQAGGFFDKSTRALFYGIGNGSNLSSETQYAVNDTYFFGRVGIHIYDELILGVGYMHRSTGINLGSDPLLPQFLNVYANQPRNSGTTTTATHIFFAYDTRAPVFAPQEGNFGFMSLSQTQPRSGEDLAQQNLLLTGENYYGIVDKDLILVSRGKYEREWGESVPFFMQTALGGADTLRGFYTNRFTDAGSMLFNEETRFTFWNTGATLIQRFELSLAFELGRVFDGATFPPFDGYHTDWDVGLTGLLEGGVPLRLDLAWGQETTLIYLHLFYPF